MNYSKALLAIVPGILFACSPYWTGARSVTTATGQHLCAKHHVPLVKITAYGIPEGAGIFDPTRQVLEAERDLPNVLNVPTRRQPPFTEKFKTEYCPECQRIFERRLKQSGSHAFDFSGAVF